MSRSKIILLIASVLLLGGGVFIWYQYNKHTSDVHLRYVPKDAAAVFVIHNREIAGKIDPAKIIAPEGKTAEENTMPSFISGMMTDPFAAGIDPIQNIYGFVRKNGEYTVTAVVGAINDADDFRQFAEKIFPGRKTEAAGDLSYIDIDDFRALAWNNEAVIFTSTNGGDIRSYTEKLFQSDESQSVLTDKGFTDFQSKSFDAGVFINNSRLAQLNATASALALIGISEGHSELLLKFEQNEIVAEYIGDPNSKAPSVFATKGPLTTDLAFLGNKNPLLFLGTSVDVKALLTASQQDPAMQKNVDDIAASLGMTRDEMSQLFTGSMVVSVSDYKNIYETDPRVQEETKKMLGPAAGITALDGIDEMMSIEVPVTSISMGITDEVKVNDMLKRLGMEDMKGFWAMPGIEMVIYAVVKSGQLVVTNDYAIASAIAQSGKLEGKLPAEYEKMVNGQPFSFWADFDPAHLPPLLIQPKFPLLGEEDLKSYASLSAVFTSMRFESTGSVSRLRLSMPASNESSLTRLINYLNQN